MTAKVLQTAITETELTMTIADGDAIENATIWIEFSVKIPLKEGQLFEELQLKALQSVRTVIGAEIQSRTHN